VVADVPWFTYMFVSNKPGKAVKSDAPRRRAAHLFR